MSRTFVKPSNPDLINCILITKSSGYKQRSTLLTHINYSKPVYLPRDIDGKLSYKGGEFIATSSCDKAVFRLDPVIPTGLTLNAFLLSGDCPPIEQVILSLRLSQSALALLPSTLRKKNRCQAPQFWAGVVEANL